MTDDEISRRKLQGIFLCWNDFMNTFAEALFITTAIDPSRSFRMTINVLYKDHGVGRQKELLAHVVRLRILACRNDLNRKRIVSLQLTAHS